MILVPLSPLHKGTIVSAPSPLLFKALHMTCLRVVLGNHQRHSTNLLLHLSRHIVAEVICYSQVHCWGQRSEIEITKVEDRPLHIRRKWVSKLCIGDGQPHEPGRSYEVTDKHYVLKEFFYLIKTH